MTPDRGIELVGAWPKDRTVPRRLAAGIQATTGRDKQLLKRLVEALYAAAETTEDLELLEKHFG